MRSIMREAKSPSPAENGSGRSERISEATTAVPPPETGAAKYR